jgi:hypothetical protein
MPNICDNFVCITGSEDVLCVLEAKDFHWFSYFPDMPEDSRTRMGTSCDENAPPIHLLRNGQGGIQAFFISAWAPPIEFYNRLVEKFGDIRIEYEYHEWSMGFAGFGIAGVAESREPTHFSYECADDINLMRRVHNWHIQIQNPHFTVAEDACSLATHSDDEEPAQN